MIVTIDFFINALIGCIMLPDYDEFVQCVDNVFIEYQIEDA